MKHTPGPWRVNKHNPFRVAAGHNLAIADTSELAAEPEECHANARLIAAAPELLHCLKVILDHADGDEMLEAQLHLDFVRAAIAKAEGE
jgi:hypothetical protein